MYPASTSLFSPNHGVHGLTFLNTESNGKIPHPLIASGPTPNHPTPQQPGLFGVDLVQYRYSYIARGNVRLCWTLAVTFTPVIQVMATSKDVVGVV